MNPGLVCTHRLALHSTGSRDGVALGGGMGFAHPKPSRTVLISLLTLRRRSLAMHRIAAQG